MRPKVVIPVLLVAGLVILLALLPGIRPATSPAPAKAPDAPPATSAPAGSAATPASPVASVPAPPAPAPPAEATASPVPAQTPNDPAYQAYVEQRVSELEAMGMKNDPVSRQAILDELLNPDRQIRDAALEAAIQFGDRSVTPRLREIADQTEDADEKAAILDAIDYLNLPSLTEFMAAQKDQPAMTNAPIRPRPHHGIRTPRPPTQPDPAAAP